MIIHHQNNVTAFAGNHVFYWVGQPFLHPRISALVAAGIGDDEIAVAAQGVMGQQEPVHEPEEVVGYD